MQIQISGKYFKRVLKIQTTKKIDEIAQKRQIIIIKTESDFFVLNQENSFIYCCCTNNLKLEIGTKKVKRGKKKESLYFYL